MASIPVFQRQGSNGLLWSFDPASGKWSVQGEGPNGPLKSSSQKLDVLVGKVRAWTEAQTAAPVAPKESVEAELMQLATGLHNTFNPVGVRVRLEWDEHKNGYTITKFRPHQEGSSWRTFQSDDLVAVDPFNLDFTALAWIQNALTIEHLEERLQTTERELIDQWLGHKQVLARGIWFNREGEIQDISLETLSQRSTMTSYQEIAYLVGQDVPVHVVPKANDELEGNWTTEPDGRIRLEKEGPWLRLCPPSLMSSSAQFELGVGEGEASHVLYSTPDSRIAIALAKALNQTRAWDLPAVEAWEGNLPSEKKAAVYWPVAVQTKAVFRLQGITKEETLFSLNEEGFLRSPKGHRKNKGWKIEAIRGERYRIEKKNWNVGPEDIIPAQAADLIEQTQALIQDLKANGTALLKGITAGKQDTLSAVAGALAEGEEPRTAQEVQQKWDRVCARLRKEAQDSEPAQRMEQLIEQAKQVIEHSLMSPPKRLKR